MMGADVGRLYRFTIRKLKEHLLMASQFSVKWEMVSFAENQKISRKDKA